MKDLSLFFSDLDREPYRTIFSGVDRVWDPLKNLSSILQALTQNKTDTNLSDGVYLDKNEKGLFMQKWIKLDQAVYLKEQNIFIG